MNKQTGVIIVIIVILLLLGGGAYMILGKKTQSPAPQAMTQTTPTANPTETTTMAQARGTLRTLMTSGKPQT